MTTTPTGAGATLIGHADPSSPEGQALRATKLGGSEIAAVIGLSPYESHLSLWWRKKGIAGPKTFDASSAQLVNWGKRYEPTVYALFLERATNIGFWDAVFMALGDMRAEETLDQFRESHPDQEWLYNPGSFTHPQRQWQLASPDAIHRDGSEIVEVKTVQNELDWGEEGTDQIPIYYRTQCIWYMSALGARRCWIPVLIRGAFYKEYVIEWNDEVATDAAILEDAGQRFIGSLINDQQPSIDGHDETLKVIRERHPEIEPGDVEIPRDLADAYIAAVLEEKSTKEIKQRWAAEILHMMGRTRNAIDETGQRIAYRKPASNGDRTPFLAADPALIRSLRPALTIQGAS